VRLGDVEARKKLIGCLVGSEDAEVARFAAGWRGVRGIDAVGSI
jgi:hypothetical protein